MLLKKIQFLVLISFLSIGTSVLHAQSTAPNKANINQLFTQAQIAFSLERYEDAYEQFQEILAIDPEFYDIYEDYGILEAYLENYESALHYFKGAYKAFPEKVHLLSMTGEVLNNLGRHQEAGASFEEHALKSSGEEQKEAYFNAWKSYWRAEDSQKAIELVDTLQNFDIERSEYIELIVSKVVLLVSDKKKEEAITAMDELILTAQNQEASIDEINTLKELKTFIYKELDDTVGLINIHQSYLEERPINPEFFKFNFIRLIQLEQINYTDSMARNFVLNQDLSEEERLLPIYAILEFNHSDSLPIVQELMDIALTEENITASSAFLKGQMIYSFSNLDSLDEGNRIKTLRNIIHWYDKSISLQPENINTYINYIEFLIENKEYDLAKVPLQLLKSQKQLEQGFYYFYNGVIHLEKDQPKEAIHHFKKGLNLKSKDSEYKAGLNRLFYINLASIYYDLKDYTLSEQYYELLLKEDPYNLYAMNNLSYLYAIQKIKLDRAEELAKTAVDADPENTNFLDTYAWVLHHLDRNLEARQVLMHALTLINEGHDRNYIYFEHLAAIEEALGNYSRAKNLYQKAIDNGGDPIELNTKILRLSQ